MDEATRISLKDQFNSLLVQAIEGRRGGMALMRVLEELDFYNSPASAKHLLNLDLQALAAVKRGFDPVALLPIHGNDGIAGNETIVHRGDVPAVAGCQLVDLLVKRCHVVRSFQRSRPQAASVRVMMSTSVWLHWQDLRS